MIILTIRTDKPEAELGLFEDDTQLAYKTWQAHKQLSVTIHTKIKELLQQNLKNWQDIEGVVCFKGPGSFTGLRIGLTVGNSLAANLNIPVVSTAGENWQKQGITRLLDGKNEKIAMPEYGRDAHITMPKH